MHYTGRFGNFASAPIAKTAGLTNKFLACGAPAERLTEEKRLEKRKIADEAQRVAQDANAIRKADRLLKKEEETMRRNIEK